MRKKFDLAAAITIAIDCFLYYVAIFILLRGGMRDTPAQIISLVVSIVAYTPLFNVITAFIEKDKLKNSIIASTVIIVMFALLVVAYKDINLEEAISSSIIQIVLYGLMIPVVSQLFYTAVFKISTIKTKKKLEESGESLAVTLLNSVEDEDKAEYGINHQIIGKYDENLAVKCDNGIFIGTENRRVIAYKGIPYAKQPVRELRWKKPERMENSSDVFEAKYFGKVSSQYPNKAVPIDERLMGEDCLNLNIWKSTDNSKKCPVLVNFNAMETVHGGCSTSLLAGDNLVREYPDIIYVSVNYRLGLFANMDFSSVPGGEEYSDSTCLGLLDQIEALHWIRRNIQSFGGDRENITLFGCFGGASSIITLSVMPKAKGLFHRAIAWGAIPILTISKELGRQLFEEFQKESKATTMDEFLALSEKDLVRMTETLRERVYLGPIRDGDNIPDNILTAFEEGKASDINFLFGKSADEMEFLADSMDDNDNVVDFLDSCKEESVKYSEEENDTISKYVAEHTTEDGFSEEERKKFYNLLLNETMVYVLCKKHAAAEGMNRFIYWSPNNESKWYKAQSIFVSLLLLDKLRGSDKFAVVGDPIFQRILQLSTVNFMKCGDPSITGGDCVGFDEIIMPEFKEDNPAMVIVNENGISLAGKDMLDAIKKLEPLENHLFKY